MTSTSGQSNHGRENKPESDKSDSDKSDSGNAEGRSDPDPDYQQRVRHEAEAKIQRIEQQQADEEAEALVPSSKGGFVLVIALMVVSWWQTFYEMWHRWFPAWHNAKWPVMDRLTEGESYYTHGPLVPFTSLVIVWYIHSRVGVPIKRSQGSKVVGWGMLVTFLIFHLLSTYARVMFVSGFALIGVLLGIILIWGGWRMMRAYWLPVVFLFFMVPLPEVWIGDLNFRLKFLAGNSSVWLLEHVFNVPAVIDGSFVYLPEGKTLVVENVCGGLRSLISLVWFASLFAMVCRVKGLWRVMMLFMAVPVAVVCNIVRITSLNLVAYYFTVEDAGPGSTFHDLSGLLVFAVALGILFGIERLIIIASNTLNRSWVDDRLMGFLESVRDGMGHAQHRFGSVVPVVVALGITSVLSTMWVFQSTPHDDGQRAKNAAPAHFVLGEATYSGVDYPLDQKTLDILETNDYLYRRYTNRDTGRELDLLIVFSANNRKGTHPPEVCIEGGGDRIIKKEILTVGLPAMNERVLSMRELLTQRLNQKAYFTYVYKSGDRYTHSFFGQQFWIFVNSLTSRNTAGALIRFSTPYHREELDATRSFMTGAVTQLMPHIDKNLP